MSYQVAAHVAARQLKILLSEFEPAPMPIQVLHREGRYAAAKVRAFVDLMVARLRGDSALNGFLLEPAALDSMRSDL